MIEFSIYNVTFQAVEGMTWEQWVNSEYNINTNLIVQGAYIWDPAASDPAYVADGTTRVLTTDVIVANKTYTIIRVGGAA